MIRKAYEALTRRHMPHQVRRSSDIDELVFRARVGKLVRWLLTIICTTSLVTAGYINFNNRLSRVECNVKMLVDITVYSQAPRQADCA